MGLQTEIEAGIKKAMLAKDQDRLRTLRAIKSAILLAGTEKGASGELSADAEMNILIKAAKQRKDSLSIFKEQGRTDLAEKEAIELAIIEEFLPQQMSEDELTEKLKLIIEQLGASTSKDMGKVMGVANKEFAGKADGKTISTIIKQLLS